MALIGREGSLNAIVHRYMYTFNDTGTLHARSEHAMTNHQSQLWGPIERKCPPKLSFAMGGDDEGGGGRRRCKLDPGLNSAPGFKIESAPGFNIDSGLKAPLVFKLDPGD